MSEKVPKASQVSGKNNLSCRETCSLNSLERSWFVLSVTKVHIPYRKSFSSLLWKEVGKQFPTSCVRVPSHCKGCSLYQGVIR